MHRINFAAGVMQLIDDELHQFFSGESEVARETALQNMLTRGVSDAFLMDVCIQEANTHQAELAWEELKRRKGCAGEDVAGLADELLREIAEFERSKWIDFYED
jgi:hypothetical protein